MRADRLVSLLLLLQARGRVTAAEAADVLEVSVPTARRDLEALAAAGVPVYAQPGRGGVWYLLAGTPTGRRTFRVDRVAAVATTGETFARPADLDVAAAWAEVQAEVERSRSRVAATVTVADHLVRVLTDVVGDRYVEPLGAADGRTRLRVRADTATMLARQLAGWADVVEVESPDAVTAELARFGALLSDRHGS